MLGVAVIGGGEEGVALIEILHEDPRIQILGVADRNADAPGIVLAKRLAIYTVCDYKLLLTLPNLHSILDASGNRQTSRILARLCPPHVELISGQMAKRMWAHVVRREKHRDTLQSMLFQYQSIYDIGLKLSASQDLERILFHTVEDATKLTHTHAGSLALYDEMKTEMYLGVSKGFSRRFSREVRWQIRKGGLTHTILNSKVPVMIPDVHEHPQFDNPIMLKEGVRAVLAAPLLAEGKIIGILYVNDFAPRQFTKRDISLFGLLGSIAANIIDKAQMLENAMRASITDELTGLYNHRHFAHQFEVAVKQVERYRREMTLVMIDIDDFKYYNDTQGHPRGNEVLRQVGALLKKNCRDVDIVARYGGEEFAIIMPETSAHEAARVLNRFRKAMADYPFKGGRQQPGKAVTLSMGVATHPGGAGARKLLDWADAALYEAKRQGKNRIVFHSARATLRQKPTELNPRKPRRPSQKRSQKTP